MSKEQKIKQKLLGAALIILGVISNVLGSAVSIILVPMGIWVFLSKQDMLNPPDDYNE